MAWLFCPIIHWYSFDSSGRSKSYICLCTINCDRLTVNPSSSSTMSAVVSPPTTLLSTLPHSRRRPVPTLYDRALAEVLSVIRRGSLTHLQQQPEGVANTSGDRCVCTSISGSPNPRLLRDYTISPNDPTCLRWVRFKNVQVSHVFSLFSKIHFNGLALIRAFLSANSDNDGKAMYKNRTSDTVKSSNFGPLLWRNEQKRICTSINILQL